MKSKELRESIQLDNRILEEVQEYPIYPANHFITTSDSLQRAIQAIKKS